MTNPQMPNIPGVAAMTDTLDFVKNLWGSMSVPGMNIPGITAPTFSVEELDKKINDMKAVETWLNLNMSMLRGTIQALEVQRGTIATLKSMGASIAAAVQQTDASSKGMFDSIPYASAFFQQAPAAQQTQADQSKAEPAEAPAAAPSPAAETADTPAQLNHPAAWWNVLQNQFTQAVATALTPDASTTHSDGASSNHADPAPMAAAAEPKSAPKRAAAKPKAAKPVK